jgi:hypothetical protein
MDNYKDMLIRQVFEAERDVAWVQFVENQAKRLGVQSNELDRLRKAFDQYLEDRDWAWWEDRAQRKYSVAGLADMLEDAARRADALGMQQWQHRQQEARGD